VRCPRCGNENPEANRFCGMCGAAMRQAPATAPKQETSVKATQGSSTATAATRTTAAPARPAPPQADAPVISGPSFLGLNQPPAQTAKRGSLSIDPHSSSRNLDYLLEDDEPRRGGGWKLAVMFIALLLAVGFGYLRWKNYGFAWLIQAGSKPSAQTTKAPDSGAPASPSSEAPLAPGAITPVPETNNPPTNTPPPNTPAPSANAPGSAPAASPSPTTSATTPPGPSAPVSAAPAPQNPSPGNSSEPATSAAEGNAANTAPNFASQAAKNADTEDDETAAPAEKPQPAPVRKPTPAITRPASDPVAEAQKYLYGKSVTQDCDHGLRLLKPAANQGNAKAMIEMGALYSAGLCTPRDLPTAYRWFALALRKEPDNESVQTDLKKLWGEMTQPERQLAIRLSQ
jgi:hypothetical protein